MHAMHTDRHTLPQLPTWFFSVTWVLITYLYNNNNNDNDNENDNDNDNNLTDN